MADRPKSPIFINSVLRPGKTHPILVAEAVDVGAQRQIRHHKKSRRGCVGCKLRKVKVDSPPPPRQITQFANTKEVLAIWELTTSTVR